MCCRSNAAACLAIAAALAATICLPARLLAGQPGSSESRAVPPANPHVGHANRNAALPGSILREAPVQQTQDMTYTAYLPFFVARPNCPTTSANTYIAVPYVGGTYKNNRLTDENADFRLSILGYAPTSAPLNFVTYDGPTDSDAPRLHGMFEPNRVPDFVRVHRVYQWNWDENAPPPYGQRGPINTGWPVTAIDFRATPGETIQIPERSAPLWADDSKAVVLYAGEYELTLVYMRADQVVVNGTGYVLHLLGLCVDPNLLALYRAQLDGAGRRATGQLPALRNNQPVGKAFKTTITVAIRDGGAYMDPRSERDWWRDHP